MMIRDHLEEEKPPKSTPKNMAGGGSGGVWEGVFGVLEPLGQGFWTGLKLMRQVKDDLGASKERLGGMLGRFGAVFGHLGRILAPSWVHLEVSWRVLGRGWRHLGGGLGQIYGYFGYAMTKHVLKPFFACFFVFSCKLTFCETLIFVAPVEVFEGFFNVRFLECKYCNPFKHT